jgi:hypothetical protein
MLLLTLLCGAGGAVLRSFQLANSFDPHTSLIESGDPVTISLMALSAAFAAAVAVYAYTLRDKAPGVPKPLGKIWMAVELAALAALFSASAVDIYIGVTRARAAAVCLGVLGLLTWAALLMISLNVNKLPFTSATGFWATVPIFWACLMLITEFWGHAGNPVRNTYVYGMLAAVFCTLALYTAAGFFFGRGKPARAALYTLPGIYFAVVTLGGSLLSNLLGDPVVAPLSLATLLRLTFIALHLSAVTAAIQYGRFTPPAPVPENKEGDA